MTTPVRITAVSYLNTLPFIYGIEQQVALPVSTASTATASEAERRPAGSDIALSLRVPALCAADAIAGQTDIALVPTAAIPLIPGFPTAATKVATQTDTTDTSIAGTDGQPAPFTPHVITDYCIGAEGAVDTVVLLSDTPLDQVRKVYLDCHSRTSVQLVRVLAREHWHIAPYWVDFADCASTFATEGHALAPGEAMVAIGDKVFALRAAHHYAYCYDLAQEWANFTGGLPFVFAAWVACTPAGAAFAPRLNQALAYGVDHIAESITGTVNRSRNFDFDTAYRYLTQSIKFRLDAPKRQAMHLFGEKIISPG